MVILIFAVIFAILQLVSFFYNFLKELSMDIFYSNEQINLVEIITSKSPK